MKTIILSFGILFLARTGLQAQGTFLYDQQSVTSDAPVGQAVQDIQPSQPMGQSFTPSFSSIDFIRLLLTDREFNNIGATVYINLRSNSINGTILAATIPVFMADGFASVTNFSFPTSVPLVPGTTYYFQPVVQSGDTWAIVHDTHFNYAGGTAFALGLPAPDYDVWFREGIFIPEPSAGILLMIGLGVLFARRPTPFRIFQSAHRYRRVECATCTFETRES